MAATAGNAGGTPNLLPGVTTGIYSDPLRGVAPGSTAYYFNGTRFLDPNQANQAATAYGQQKQAQETNNHAQSVQPYVGAAMPAPATPGAPPSAGPSGPASIVPGGYPIAGGAGGNSGGGGGADSNLLAPGQVNGGAAPVSQSEADAERMLGLRVKANNDTFSGRLAQLSAAGATSMPSHVDVNTGPGSAAYESAANAAFARAKDQAGRTANASLDALKNLMAERGLSGGTAEAEGEAGVIGGAGSDIADFNTRQEEDALAGAAHVRDETYQGNITQRGQDLQKQQSLLGLLTATGLY